MNASIDLLDYCMKNLIYKPENGLIYWNGASIYEAGSTHHSGYRNIQINRRKYQVHRIAWLMHHKKFTKNYIDHINGNRSDNRITNLREATRRENQTNRKCHRSGHLSGTTQAPSGRWQSRITVNKKHIYLGTFNNQEDAHNCYKTYLNSTELEL